MNDILECLNEKIGLPVRSEGSTITWAGEEGVVTYEAEAVDGAVNTDYGLIVRGWQPVSQRTVGRVARGRVDVRHDRGGQVLRGAFAEPAAKAARSRWSWCYVDNVAFVLAGPS